MEVILLQQINKLGKIGDVVKVKTGYARNYLLPQKKALRSTKENLAVFEAQKAELEAKHIELKNNALALAQKLQGLSVSLIRQASEAGVLYGSVTARDIYDAVKKAGLDIERSHIVLNQPIKNIGVYEIELNLHPEVSQSIRAIVARSAEENIRLETEAVKAEQAAETENSEKEVA